MKAIIKTINAFLTACVDYSNNRIITGKFLGDSIEFTKSCSYLFSNAIKQFTITVHRSFLFMQGMKALLFLWHLLLKIPITAVIVTIITDAGKIFISFYSEIFIVFAFTFTSSILLLNFFQASLQIFFSALIPILLLDILFISALYLCIDSRESGTSISIWKSLIIVFRNYPSFSLPLLIESAISLEAIIVFFILALFFSYIFNFFQIPWGGSLLFWFVIIFTGSITAIGIFFMNLILQQTFFMVLLDNITFQQALKRSRRQVNTLFSYYLFFYVLFVLFSCILLGKAFFSYLYLGVTISLYCITTLGIFLGYLLRRAFPSIRSKYTLIMSGNQKIYIFSLILIFFGCINYFLLATLFIKEQQPIFTFFQQQQDNFLASQEVKKYTNSLYGYILEYPKQWSLYQWNKNSVTFYNNYTGSLTGGTWMTITVSSYKPDVFMPLFDANPGVTTNNLSPKTITTKVANLTVQGYRTVNYTKIKQELPYSRYETHYLIHKNNLLYDIAFVSVTNDVGNYNSTLFQKIINSFRFTTN